MRLKDGTASRSCLTFELRDEVTIRAPLNQLPLFTGRHLERMPVIPSLLSGQALSASFGSGSTDAEILRCAQDDRKSYTLSMDGCMK